MALPYIGLLLGMQAAGMVIDYRETKSQQKLIGLGRQAEKAALDTNLEAIRLESSEASLAEMKQLRQNLGSQIAMQAARGTSTGAGSAMLFGQKSIASFNADERVRRMNLLGKEAQLRAQNALSGLHTLQSETQLGQNLTKRMLNTLPISAGIDEFRRSPLGKKWGFGLEETA